MSSTAIFNINININKSLLGPQSSIDIYLYFWLYREYEEVVGEEDNIIEAILILYNTVSATRYQVGNIVMLVFDLKLKLNQSQ